MDIAVERYQIWIRILRRGSSSLLTCSAFSAEVLRTTPLALPYNLPYSYLYRTQYFIQGQSAEMTVKSFSRYEVSIEPPCF